MARHIVLIAALMINSAASEPDLPTQKASAMSEAERKLVTLLDAYDEALQEHRSKVRASESKDKPDELSPNENFIPKLLAFEEQHRGENVGLIALERIFREAGRGGFPGDARQVGRREAVSRLSSYFAADLFAMAFLRANLPYFEVEIDKQLREYAESNAVPEKHRPNLKLSRAEAVLDASKSRTFMEERIKRLGEGAEPRFENEGDYWQQLIKRTGSRDELNRLAATAMDDLRKLASEPNSPRRRSLQVPRGNRHFIKLVDNPDNPTVADSAKSLLFKWEHLQVGVPTPKLDVELVNEKPWSLAKQRGKVVVVMFSFTGCGPCERMYPDLKKLQKGFPDRLEILTLMSDETPEVCKKKIADGVFTWSIVWDDKAAITRQWSVASFPTFYLIDQDGTMAGADVTPDQLLKLVRELLGLNDSNR